MTTVLQLIDDSFGFEGRIWDLIVSVPDHCLSFYFARLEHVVFEDFSVLDDIKISFPSV